MGLYGTRGPRAHAHGRTDGRTDDRTDRRSDARTDTKFLQIAQTCPTHVWGRFSMDHLLFVFEMLRSIFGKRPTAI